MEKQIKNILKKAPGMFQTYAPKEGHELRFLQKLNAHQNLRKPTLVWRKKTFQFLAVAACITILFGVFRWGAYTQNTQAHIRSIAPEAIAMNQHYTGVVAMAIKEIKAASNPLIKPHIDKALLKIKQLEDHMEEMEQDLINGGNTKLILQGMIQNYTTRVELLEEVINQIETINNINQNTNGTS